MKRYLRVALLGLLLAAALSGASCGGSTQQGEDQQGSQEDTTSGTQGMSSAEMSGMETSSSAQTAPKDLIVDGQYSDERFIDMMSAHHQMAIDMARVAQQNAQLPEIKQIADDIVSTQQKEIEEFKSIKGSRFGSSEVPTAMNPEEPSMRAMAMPDELARQDPFDRAFIDSMIPHHASAIEMASTASRESRDPELERTARVIVDAQSREIGEMIALRQQYYTEG